MRPSAKALFAASLGIIALAGCADQKSKDRQAAEFYEKKLHVDDEKACNDKGFMYDTLTAACQDVPPKALKLAKFPCTEAGVTSASTKEDEAGVKKLKTFVAEGYELRQCGVADSGTIVVILILKGRTDDEATLTVERLQFLGQAVNPAKKIAAREDGKLFKSLVFGDMTHETAANTSGCAKQHVEYRQSDGESAPEMTNAPADVRFKLTYSAKGVTVFRDGECKSALASGDEIVITAGNKFAAFFYKTEATYEARFEVNPDAQDVKVPEPLAVGDVQ